jgi:hypothetical protein
MSGVEAEDEKLLKKQKVLEEECDIVVIDEEGESNLPYKGIIIEQENSTKQSNTSFSDKKKTISQSKFKTQQAKEDLQVKTIIFSQQQHSQYK